MRFSLRLRTIQAVRGPKFEICSAFHDIHRSVVLCSFCLTIHRNVTSELMDYSKGDSMKNIQMPEKNGRLTEFFVLIYIWRSNENME